MNTPDLTPTSFPEDYEAESAAEAAPRRTNGLALAIALAALASGLLTILALDSGDRPMVERPQDCAAVTDTDARLSCYDVSVHRAASQPARGALAPSPTK